MQPQIYQYSQVSEACMNNDSFTSQSPTFSIRSSDCCHQQPSSADFSKNYTQENSLSLILKKGEQSSHNSMKMQNKNILEKISNKSKRIAKVKIFFGQKCSSSDVTDCEKDTYEKIDYQQPKSQVYCESLNKQNQESKFQLKSESINCEQKSEIKLNDDNLSQESDNDSIEEEDSFNFQNSPNLLPPKSLSQNCDMIRDKKDKDYLNNLENQEAFRNFENHEKCQQFSEKEIKEKFNFDFSAYLTEKEKKNKDINLEDKEKAINLIEGKDFDLSSVVILKHAPQTTLFNIYEYRSHKKPRRVIRLLNCTHPGCDKVFRKWYNFFNHLRIHTNEKPYKCEYQGCNQRFAQQANLKKHSDIHIGIKRFECQYCSKQFFTNFNLHSHLKVHQKKNNTMKKDMGLNNENIANDALHQTTDITQEQQQISYNCIQNCQLNQHPSFSQEVNKESLQQKPQSWIGQQAYIIPQSADSYSYHTQNGQKYVIPLNCGISQPQIIKYQIVNSQLLSQIKYKLQNQFPNRFTSHEQNINKIEEQKDKILKLKEYLRQNINTEAQITQNKQFF